MKRRSVPYATILSLITKSAKLFKFFKFGKLLLTFSSMLLSVLVYSFMLGPWFAVGFVLMLFIHEMGHIIALRAKGYDVPGPVFIPMVGAVIFAPRFRNSQEEAAVGYAGPLVGGLAGLVAVCLWFTAGRTSELLLLISYTAIWLNLFNLIPIRPLDGGRVMQIAGRWAGWIGAAVLLAFSVMIKEPSILLIWVLVLQDVKIQPQLKAVAATCFFVSMAVLMSFGYGKQKLWMNILDCCLSGIFILVYWAHAKDDLDTFDIEAEDYRTTLSVSTKVKWIALYTCLGVVLGVAMAFLAPYLPVPHK